MLKKLNKYKLLYSKAIIISVHPAYVNNSNWLRPIKNLLLFDFAYHTLIEVYDFNVVLIDITFYFSMFKIRYLKC